MCHIAQKTMDFLSMKALNAFPQVKSDVALGIHVSPPGQGRNN